MLAQRRLGPLFAAFLALPVPVLAPALAQAMEAHESGRSVDVVLGADGRATFTETVALDVVYGPVERLTFGGAPDATPTVHVERVAVEAAPGQAAAPAPAPTAAEPEIARTVGRDGEARFVLKFPKKSALARGNYRIAISWAADLSHLVHRNGGRTTLTLAGLVHEQSVDDAHFTVHTPDFGAPSVGNTEGFAAKVSVEREAAGYKLELGRAHISRGERFSAPLVFGAGAFPAVVASPADGAKDDAETPQEPVASPTLAPEVARQALAASPAMPRGALPFAVALPLAFAALVVAKLRSRTEALSDPSRPAGLSGLLAAALVGGGAFGGAIVAFLAERDAIAAGLLAVAVGPLLAAPLLARKNRRPRVRGAGEWLAVVDAEAVAAPRTWEPHSPLARALTVVLLAAGIGIAATLFSRDARLAAAVLSFVTPFLIALRSFPRDQVAPRERHAELLVNARKQVVRAAGPLAVRATLLARYPLGSQAWDDLRLLVTAKDTLPGLRSIEAGLLRDENEEAVPLAEVHVRVFAGSEAHERLLARYGAAGFAPGRIPEERVLRLRASRPGAEALAETLATVARALVERRERRPVAAPVASTLAPVGERRRPRVVGRRSAASRGDSLPAAAAIG